MLRYSSLLLLALFFVASTTSSSEEEWSDYGLDCSWPIHSMESTCGDQLGDRKSIYEDYMQGCREKWGEKGAKRCDANEQDRLQMSRRQPQSMVNYTSTGFKKIKAPKPLWDIIRNYWEKNKDDMKEENWGMGNVYTNNWAVSCVHPCIKCFLKVLFWLY